VQWLSSAYRRCLKWVCSWLKPPRIVVPIEAIASEDPQIVATCPDARVYVQMEIRRDTPPGIARLAAILSECASENA
jgi:hypothetical protein